MQYMVKETLIDWKLYACGANGQIYSYYWKKYLSGTINKYGYIHVTLKCIDGKQRIFRWHRVIWTFFYGTIPEGMQVNHIDENKQNNALSNLNLMTPKENSNWGTRNERRATKRRGIPNLKLKGHKVSEETKRRIAEKQNKRIIAYNDDGEIIHEFESMSEAKRHGFNIADISECCNGKRNKHKGLHWEKI